MCLWLESLLKLYNRNVVPLKPVVPNKFMAVNIRRDVIS